MNMFWLIVVTVCVQPSSTELYSALAGLDELLNTQKTILGVFDRYLEYSNARMTHIQRLKHEYHHLLELSSRDFPHFISNPINAFVLIKKLTIDWNEAQQIMFGAHQEIVGTAQWKSSLFPDYKDLLGAAQALLRLQQTYHLETLSLANGKLMDAPPAVNLTGSFSKIRYIHSVIRVYICWHKESPSSADTFSCIFVEKLSPLKNKTVKNWFLDSMHSQSPNQAASDCFELGRQAFYSGQFDYSILWLEMANEKLLVEAEEESRKEGMYDENQRNILRYLTLSTFEKGKISAFQLAVQLGFHINQQIHSFSKIENSPENQIPSSRYNSKTNPVDEAVYRELCSQGKNVVLMHSRRPSLTCRHVVDHPYYVLQPAMEEQLSTDPKISVFYNAVTDHEIEILKSLALPKLERAEVAQYSGNLTHRVSENRVTKIAWLSKRDHPTVLRIYRRIEDITGLSSQTAEPLQIANYGLGGHFHLHMDVLPDTEAYFGPEQGNRIATWLIYLSDVENGGATVFPRLNLTVWPQKGSALFWYNIRSNGIGDSLTIHGACPVITGTKWISNAWLHERSQEFRLRCSLDQHSQLTLTRN